MISAEPPDDLTLITVTSRNYLPGTWVALHSFRAANRWFKGEAVVLHDDLTENDQAVGQLALDNVRFAHPSQELYDAVAKLAKAYPELRGRERQFYSLDALHPNRDGTVLFCDSDLLFRTDISAFFADLPRFLACGDRAQLDGTGRDPLSHEELNGEQPTGFDSFNAGLMAIGPQHRSAEIWDQVLAQLQVDQWSSVASAHTDQAIYNRLFGKSVALADPSFNFMVGHAPVLGEDAGCTVGSAKVLHFNGPAKPWTAEHHFRAAAGNASFVKALELWNTAYSALLSEYYFRAQ